MRASVKGKGDPSPGAFLAFRYAFSAVPGRHLGSLEGSETLNWNDHVEPGLAAVVRRLRQTLKLRSDLGLDVNAAWMLGAEGNLSVAILESLGTNATAFVEAFTRRFEAAVTSLPTYTVPIVVTKHGRALGQESSFDLDVVLDAAAFAVVLSPGSAPFGRSELRCLEYCRQRGVEWVFVIVDPTESADDLLEWAPQAARSAGLDAAIITRLGAGGFLTVVDEDEGPRSRHCVASVTIEGWTHALRSRILQFLLDALRQTDEYLGQLRQYWLAKARRFERVTGQLEFVEDHLRIQVESLVSAYRLTLADLPTRIRFRHGRRRDVEAETIATFNVDRIVAKFGGRLVAESLRFARAFPDFEIRPPPLGAGGYEEFSGQLERVVCDVLDGVQDAEEGSRLLLTMFDNSVAPHLTRVLEGAVADYAGRIRSRIIQLAGEATLSTSRCDDLRRMLTTDSDIPGDLFPDYQNRPEDDHV